MIRVGIGYDIHRTAEGRDLILGGVAVPHLVGLEGHSDADVAIHALIDAMLGAAALGDIGHYFPPSDERFRSASSLSLLQRVVGLLKQSAYQVVNADIVIVAEKPRLAEHIPMMRQSIADVIGVDIDLVSVKATTNEGVGSEGRCEAISAQAVVLLEKM